MIKLDFISNSIMHELPLQISSLSN